LSDGNTADDKDHPVNPFLLAALFSVAIVPLASQAHPVNPESAFTDEPWPSYGLQLTEEKEVRINTIRFDQQRQRFEVTRRYIAKLPSEIQEELAAEMTAIDESGDKAINEVLSPEERAMHQKLKAQHQADVKLWEEFQAWKIKQ
jgi:hypothetical protein